MKRLVFGFMAVVLATATLVAPAAQESLDEAIADSDGFSLGIILGAPTGLSAKLWLAENSAVDAAVAWDFNRDRFHFHADYLQHFFGVFDVAPDRLPVYVGIGGNIRVRGDAPGDQGELRSGVRVPIGISYLATELPLELFAEAVPGLRLIPDTQFETWWGVGVRYRF